MNNQEPTRGFVDDLRAQGCLVRGAVLIGAAVVSSPFIGIAFAIIGSAFGGGGVALAVLGLLGIAGWWLGSEPGPRSAVAPSAAVPNWDPAHEPWRYCTECGASFGLAAPACPECDTPWARGDDIGSVAFLANVLNDLTAGFMEGALDRATFHRMREIYERRLQALRPEPVLEPAVDIGIEEAAVAPVAMEMDAAVPVASPTRAIELGPAPAMAAIAPPMAVEPPEPSTPFGEALVGWAAERQADILLYLGAFLVSMAALIFVAYQGEAVSPIVRVAILTAYTLAFLSLGLSLHRWERTREAGPIFLALGAILVPIAGFAALRVDVFGDEGGVPKDVLWLIGSSASGLLYAVLAWRGYGRYYAVPTVPAALVAWGSLGSVVNLPDEWFGAWFAVPAAAAYLAGTHGRLPYARWVELGGAILGGGAIAYAGAVALDASAHEWQLSTTLGIGGAAGIAALRFRRSAAALSVLPLLVASATAAANWAAMNPEPAWYGWHLAIAGAGYLLIAHFDRMGPAGEWRGIAMGPLGVAAAYAVATNADAPPLAFAATIGAGAVVLGAGVARWRLEFRAGLSGLPAAVAAAGGGLFFEAWDVEPEWALAWAAVGAVGYLALADWDGLFRQAWQSVALAGGAIAAAGAVTVAAEAGAGSSEEFVLPVVLGIAALGCAGGVARWRLEWRPGMATLPVLLPAAGASLAWAWGEMPLEWGAAWVAAVCGGYLLVAVFDSERAEAWRTTALAAGAFAVGYAWLGAPAIDEVASERFVLPVAQGIVLASVLIGQARWRLAWRPGIATMPALAASTAGTLAYAWLGMPAEWAPVWVAGAAVGYLAPALLDGHYRMAWRWTAILVGAVAVPAALAAVVGIDEESDRQLVLPATLGVLAAGNLAGVAFWRLTWRDGIVTLPAMVAATAGTFAWAAFDISTAWTGFSLAVAAAGYLVPAVLDTEVRQRWRALAYGFGAAALLAAHGATTPVDVPDPAQLPATYAVLLALALADGWRSRDWALALPPLLTSALGASLLWSMGVGAEWWAFPAVGIAILLAGTERAWARGPAITLFAWVYALALAAIPALVSIGTYEDAPGHGLVAFAATAILFGGAATRSRGDGIRWLEGQVDESLSSNRVLAINSERATLWYSAAAFAFAAAGYFNQLREIGGSDRAWVFLGLGVAAWLTATVLAPRHAPVVAFAVPPALVATSLASGLAAASPGSATIVLVVAAVMPALAFVTTRFPPFWLAASIFASLAAWAAWTWADLPDWTLAGAYAVSAALVWLALFGARRYGRFDRMRDGTVHALSWAPWVLAGGTAWLVVSERSTRLAAGEALVTTPEWATLVSIVAAGSAAITAEGWRLQKRYVQQAGTAGLLVSLLMTIAIGEPANVQAYAAPIGLYIVGTALAIRRSDELFGRHMDLHEGLMVIGALFIVLPPAAQGLEPGGEIYGLELIGIGLAFLLVGFVLHARWLVPVGVLAISGVAVRWLTGGFVAVPFWLILGLVGTGLLGFGTFILLQRERWDAWRASARSWWLRSTGAPELPEAPAG